jgi:hypothetical protein
MSSNLMDYFNKQPRTGTLSTSSKAGKVNSAYFESPYMVRAGKSRFDGVRPCRLGS